VYSGQFAVHGRDGSQGDGEKQSELEVNEWLSRQKSTALLHRILYIEGVCFFFFLKKIVRTILSPQSYPRIPKPFQSSTPDRRDPQGRILE
jgi:hypothetical protein